MMGLFIIRFTTELMGEGESAFGDFNPPTERMLISLSRTTVGTLSEYSLIFFEGFSCDLRSTRFGNWGSLLDIPRLSC